MNGVVTAWVERVALTKPPEGQPYPSPQPVPFQRSHRVFRTGGPKPTDGRSEARVPLIKMNKSNQDPCHWFARRLPSRPSGRGFGALPGVRYGVAASVT